jgi:hypothetical protein
MGARYAVWCTARTRRESGCTHTPSRWPNAGRSRSSAAGWISAWSVSALSISAALRPAPSLFLVTVADAQGLRVYSERSLCQRVSMSTAVVRQARQARIAWALVASQSPLSQVLALDRDTRRPAAEPSAGSGDDEPVARKAVFKQIWEVVS